MLYRNPELDAWKKMKGKPDEEYLQIGRMQKPERVWCNAVHIIEVSGRKDILENNPMILDIGGGDALLADYLEKNQNVKCVSLDVQKYAKKNEAMRVTADMYKLPFADKSFDVVMSHAALDTNIYMHDFAKLAPELARVLKDRGLFYDNMGVSGVGMENIDELKKYFKMIWHADKDNGTDPDRPRPVWQKL